MASMVRPRLAASRTLPKTISEVVGLIFSTARILSASVSYSAPVPPAYVLLNGTSPCAVINASREERQMASLPSDVWSTRDVTWLKSNPPVLLEKNPWKPADMTFCWIELKAGPFKTDGIAEQKKCAVHQRRGFVEVEGAGPEPTESRHLAERRAEEQQPVKKSGRRAHDEFVVWLREDIYDERISDRAGSSSLRRVHREARPA